MLVSFAVAAVACTGANDNENSGQTSARSSHNGNGNPPGNNGTVKIQEVGDPLEIPDNDPHVGCSFQIEFRGYDEGDLQATWELAGHAPSGNGEIVKRGSLDIGGDPAGGANDVDGVVVVNLTAADLAGLTAHPIQGYHLKLTVNAEGSQGADKKHKVFWVDGCGTSSSSSGGSTSSSGGSTSSSGGQTW